MDRQFRSKTASGPLSLTIAYKTRRNAGLIGAGHQGRQVVSGLATQGFRRVGLASLLSGVARTSRKAWNLSAQY